MSFLKNIFGSKKEDKDTVNSNEETLTTAVSGLKMTVEKAKETLSEHKELLDKDPENEELINQFKNSNTEYEICKAQLSDATELLKKIKK